MAMASALRVRLRTSTSRLKTAPNVTRVTAGKPTASFALGVRGDESAYCRIAVDAANPKSPHTLSTCLDACEATGRYSAGISLPAMASRSAARKLSTGARSSSSPMGNTSTAASIVTRPAAVPAASAPTSAAASTTTPVCPLTESTAPPPPPLAATVTSTRFAPGLSATVRATFDPGMRLTFGRVPTLVRLRRP
jgi:hypothetical protein